MRSLGDEGMNEFRDARTRLGSRSSSRLPKQVRTSLKRLRQSYAVGPNVTVGSGFNLARGAIISAPHDLEIGVSVSVGTFSLVQVDGLIDDFVMVGQRVQVLGRQDHAAEEMGIPYIFSTHVSDRPGIEKDRVSIGRDVWIGGGAIIVSGVSIGEGALIAAGSVVVKDVEPYQIVAGNPATFVRWRFSSEEARINHSRGLDRWSALWRNEKS